MSMDDLVYAKNMKKAVDYIEANITDGPDFAGAAAIAGMSKDNFWRVFKKLFNETIGNYIRARKLTLIARRLTSTREGIAEIALEYGYGSPEIFTRAFKKQFFTTPAEYRKRGRNMYFYERQKLTEKAIRHFLSGGINLYPAIVKICGFEITGRAYTISLKNAVPGAVAAATSFFKDSSKLFKRGEKKFYVHVTASKGHDINAFTTDGSIDIVSGNFVERQVPGFIKKHIPGGRYAMFAHKGSIDRLLISYDYIFGNWLRRRMKKPNKGYFFEMVHKRPPFSSKFEAEIYVPL